MRTNFEHVHLELDPNKVLYAPDNEGVVQYEEWRDIPGYEGYYQCSSFGRVKSLERFCKHSKGNFLKKVNSKILKAHLNYRGYVVVGLCKDGVDKKLSVHQLVAIAFLNHNTSNRKIVVDHIDNIKHNNLYFNLQSISNRKNTSKDRKGGTSRYAGVSKNKKAWQAHIYINGKQKYLGSFKEEIDAKNAYQNKLKSITKEK